MSLIGRHVALARVLGLAVVAALTGMLLTPQPVAAKREGGSVRYEITFEGLFDADALASGTAVPSDAGFGGVVGGLHNSQERIWVERRTASDGVEDTAETGGYRALRAEIEEGVDDGYVWRSFRSTWQSLDATAQDTVRFETTEEFPLLTMMTRIAPSPDWFVGLSKFNLRPDGQWLSGVTIDLYPFDAGTEDGSGFDDDNPDTTPRGTVTSLRNSGVFSDSPIARVTINLRQPPRANDVLVTPGDGQLDLSWKAAIGASGYKVQWKSADEGFSGSDSDGRQAVVTGNQNTSYTISDLENGTEYTVRVIATNPGGDAVPSKQHVGTPVAEADDTVLVANIYQNPGLNAQLTLSASTPQFLQAFTTGAQGADLGGITLADLRGVQPNTEISVSLYSSSGSGRTLLHTLVAPSTLETGSNATFTAVAGETVTLAANTTYFVQVDHVAGSLSLSFTHANGEDPQTDAGWSMANECRSRDESSPSFSGCFFSKVLRMVVTGSPPDSRPELSISGASVVESSSLDFTVTLSEAASEEVTVEYSTSDGTATADANAADGADYSAATAQTLTFAAGDTTKTLSVATTDDTVDEDDETLTVTLSNPSAAARLGPIASATGTIVNNDETPATDATLSSFSLTGGDGTAITLSPSFGRYGFQYTASVANDIDSLTASVAVNSSGAGVSIIGDDDTTSAGEASFDLTVGSNLVKVMVTSSDSSRTKIYMAVVTRAASDDATLSALTLTDPDSTAVPLAPATFDPATTDYTASVVHEVTSVTVAATKYHTGASVQIITADGTTEGPSATVDLDPGDNFIKAMVTAEDGTTAKIYKVFVNRAVTGIASDATLASFDLVGSNGAEPLLWWPFNPTGSVHEASVAHSVTSVTATVTPTRSAATLQFLDGDPTGIPGQVTRDLAVGRNRVKVIVTAADRVSSKIYITYVNRAASDASNDATLSDLSLADADGSAISLDPSTFDPATTDYTASVTNDVRSVTVTATSTDADAVPLIFSQDGTYSYNDHTVDLTAGDNPIKVMVSAADATTTKIYNLTVTRSASENGDDATLSAFELTDGANNTVSLTPAFDPATTVYTASVSNDIGAVTLATTTNHSGAAATVIEADGTSTAGSATVDLDVGENLIKAMVTSEDGTESVIYMVTVTRAASTDARLSTLTLDDDSEVEVLLGPSFDAGTGQYEAVVPNSVQSVTASATSNHDQASMVFVGGTATGTAGEATYDLADGDGNLVKVMVTAEDDATTKIYMVVVTRASSDASDDATLSAVTLTGSDGTAVELSPAFDAATTNYTASVRSGTSQVTASATTNHSGAWPLVFTVDGSNVPDSRTVDLDVGENLIKFMVTAEDGATTKIYMVTVTRPDPAADATLNALSLTDGTAVSLTPSFDPDTTDYTASVPYGTTEVTVAAVKNHSGAAVAVIEADGTSTPDQATVDLDVGENLIKAMVTSEDQNSAVIYRITVTRPPAWSATLTVGTQDAVPAMTGYLLWGTGFGELSDEFFWLGTAKYRVLSVMEIAGGLYLNTTRALPGDFTLTIGDHEFVASDSLDHFSVAAGRYWWSAGDLAWSDGEEVQVSITPAEGSQELASRDKASPVAYVTDVPESHSGTGTFSFQLHFTDNVKLGIKKLRDRSLEITNATATKARRATKGSNLIWNITIRPDSSDDITVTLPATQDCTADTAICTSDDRKHTNTITITIPGP